jgi:predicted RNA-binding Zn-ribbon protein involved in translation (DUF1610 family)
LKNAATWPKGPLALSLAASQTSRVVNAPVCEECGRAIAKGQRGWLGYLVDLDDDGEDEVLFFCPRCAEREFGAKGRSP